MTTWTPVSVGNISASAGARIGLGAARVALAAARALIVIAVVSLMVSTVPALFGLAPVRVMGASMGRQAPIGSIAILRPTESEDVRVGDVILFSRSARTVATMHRVIRLSTEHGEVLATTQGDANRSPDPTPVPLRGRGGVLVGQVPLVGFVATLLSIRLVAIGVVIAAMALFLFDRRSERVMDSPNDAVQV